ncbi:hypothetical protein OS493_014533 [Desmophyllum pertusum]|uniref:Uncharacterized protein n=1 Tax=Desmophyllum pertusum TaxID=174260 RepID=A0A9W9YPY2_9CNID|nr:hypothetical protein OS493_014533 [Desmophyllum pertusum]
MEFRMRSLQFRTNHRAMETNPESNKALKWKRALDAGNEQLPVCQHGAACNETDLIHFAEFWHPTEKQDGDDNNNDGDENYEENECEVIELPYYEAASTQPVFDEDYSDSGSENGEAETSDAQKSEERIYSTDSLGSQLSRDDTVLSRGPSIVKCYSLLSETERRELIRRAFEMKDLLKKELDKTLGIIEEKNKELRRVHSQLERGHLMVDGGKRKLWIRMTCAIFLFSLRENIKKDLPHRCIFVLQNPSSTGLLIQLISIASQRWNTSLTQS